MNDTQTSPQRVIKFRAWDKQYSVMLSGVTVYAEATKHQEREYSDVKISCLKEEIGDYRRMLLDLEKFLDSSSFLAYSEDIRGLLDKYSRSASLTKEPAGEKSMLVMDQNLAVQFTEEVAYFHEIVGGGKGKDLIWEHVEFGSRNTTVELLGMFLEGMGMQPPPDPGRLGRREEVPQEILDWIESRYGNDDPKDCHYFKVGAIAMYRKMKEENEEIHEKVIPMPTKVRRAIEKAWSDEGYEGSAPDWYVNGAAFMFRYMHAELSSANARISDYEKALKEYQSTEMSSIADIVLKKYNQ